MFTPGGSEHARNLMRFAECRNESLEGRLRAYFGEHITDAHLKMAEAPAGMCILSLANP